MAEYIMNMLDNYWFWGSVGFFLGSCLCVRNMMKNGCSFPLAVTAITVGIYFGMLGTRVLWVFIFSPWLWIERPLLAIAFWRETGTWLGAPIGGTIGLLLVFLTAKKPFWSNAGSISPGLALAHVISRIGCLFAGCCYGLPTSVPWAIYSEELNAMVHPTQVYSMIGEAVSVVILQVLWRIRSYRKYLLPGYIVLLGTHRFINGFFRGDYPGPEIISGLRVYQSICIYLFVAALSVMLVLRWRKRGLVIGAVMVVSTIALTLWFHPANPEDLTTSRVQASRYLVITRSCFVDELGDWKSERVKEGYSIMVKDWQEEPSAEEIKAWIEEQTKTEGGICSFILIVGDCAAEEDRPVRWHMPSIEKSLECDDDTLDFVSDSLYGDIDGDNCPDIPVGRLSVQTTDELRRQISKIISHKYQEIMPDWYRAVIWAGSEGYTTEIGQITTALTRRLPKWVSRYIICADPNSIYSGYIPDQPRVFLEELSNPAFISAIVAHGSFRSVTPITYEGKPVFLCVEDVENLNSTKPSGPLFMLSCDTGMFNLSQSDGRCLSEAFCDKRGGPICVAAASESPHPLTKYFIVAAMMNQLSLKPATVGDFFVGVQRELYRQGKRSLVELAKDDELAKKLMQALPENLRGEIVLPKFVRSEIMMYNLLGDPGCPLKLPGEMELSAMTSEKGEMIVEGQTPTRCTELFVEMVKGDVGTEKLELDLSKNVRMEKFETSNQRPRIILQKGLTGKSWRARFFVPTTYFGNEDYLRFIAVGPGKGYIGLEGAYREKPFADRYRSERPAGED